MSYSLLNFLWNYVFYVSVAYLVLKISIKMYFLSNCNFREFVTFFTKKTRQTVASHFSRWRPRKNVILLQFFMVVQFIKIAIESHLFLAAIAKMTYPRLTSLFSFFFCEKSYKFAKIGIWRKIHFYRYFKNHISYRYIQYIILKEI